MARRIEVLLVQDVLKLGNMGDIIKVAPGYARNYLFPYQLAKPAETAQRRQVEKLREIAAKSEADREAKAKVQAKQIMGLTIQVAARVAHDDELFGSIGTKEIVAALAAKGVKVDGKQIHLVDKLRKIGRYDIEVKLHKNVGVTIKLEVLNSDPGAPSLDEQLKAVADKRAAEKAAKKAAKSGEAPAEGAAAEGEAKADAGDKPAKGGKAKADAGDKPKGEKPAKGDMTEKAAASGKKKG